MISEETLNSLKKLHKEFHDVPSKDRTVPYVLLLSFNQTLLNELEILQKEFVEVEKRLDKTILLLDCEPTAH